MPTTVRQLKSFVDWFKASAPCVDCDKFFPACSMDLDHIPERGTKEGNIKQFIVRGDELGLWLELAKCELVCACCHRVRTVQRGVSSEKRSAIAASTAGKSKKRSRENHWEAGSESARKQSESLSHNHPPGSPSRIKQSQSLRAYWVKRRAV